MYEQENLVISKKFLNKQQHSMIRVHYNTKRHILNVMEPEETH